MSSKEGSLVGMYREGPNLTFDTDSKVVFERMNSAHATMAMMAINEVVRWTIMTAGEQTLNAQLRIISDVSEIRSDLPDRGSAEKKAAIIST